MSCGPPETWRPDIAGIPEDQHRLGMIKKGTDALHPFLEATSTEKSMEKKVGRKKMVGKKDISCIFSTFQNCG
jgi:hypothetical protein